MQPPTRTDLVGMLLISYCYEPSVVPSSRAFHLDSLFNGSSATGKRALQGPHSVLVTDLVE